MIHVRNITVNLTVSLYLNEGQRFYSQMLLFSRKRMREKFDTFWLVGIHFWVERSGDFVNEESDLLHQIAAVFNLIILQKKKEICYLISEKPPAKIIILKQFFF